MKIKIPYYKQEKDYTCGPAVLRMVFEFFGITKSEKWLRKKMGVTSKITSKKGTPHRELIRIATEEGFHCYVNSNSDIFEIIHFLRLKLPVIVDFLEPAGEEGHYAVVSHVSRFFGPTVYLNDPYNGEGFKLSEKEFISRWQDPLTKSKRWIMVLAKKNFNTGKQFLPKKIAIKNKDKRQKTQIKTEKNNTAS